MTILSVAQWILITIQIVIVCIMFHKGSKDTLTDEQVSDYQRANWLCCAGVIFLGIIGFII